MNKNTLVLRTKSFGDFSIGYSRVTKEGRKVRAFEMGTSELGNKYILAQLRALRKPMDEVQALKLVAKNLEKGDFTFWSWTANRLVTIPAKSVSRVSSMSAELDNGRQL